MRRETTASARTIDIILNGTFFRNSNGTASPAFGSWDANALPPTNPVPFSPSVGNGSVLYGFDVKTSGLWPYNEAWNVSVERILPGICFLLLHMSVTGTFTFHRS